MADLYSIEHARKLDRQDPIRGFRDQFVRKDPRLIYLDGNSLGCLPLQSTDHLNRVVLQQWGQDLITSWNKQWYDLPLRLGEKIARIIGARSEEVIISDSTSVNLYKLAFGALRYQGDRSEIISEEMNFPTDLYILQGLIKHLGNRHILKLLKSSDGIAPDLDELEAMLSSDTALLCLSHVAFKSGYMFDMKYLTDLAHRRGTLVLWDLSHSVGAVPIKLNDCGVDLAVGCTYKYLNGGPGAPAFLYVRKELQEEIGNPIQGWFGERDPFSFGLQYREADGIRKFLTGTPPVISLSALEPALDMILEAGVGSIRKKSEAQSHYLLALVRQWFKGTGVKIGSPLESERRGSHISLKHRDAYRICKALMDPGLDVETVIPDFREPDNIRLGISPLYTSFEDLHRANGKLRMILEGRHFENYSRSREQVT